ncbi:ABZJ_00895 family protein [Paracoccus sp. (in: a-proteobacteria)]|uniref:ABZJ_00895 family protein n=1 Tax=Paracoccus sp. TaxID=267 RepID=UPI00289C5A7F|nr:ABZJ_00895 family protein [Paracoccus sp. (in: a-proteobacteria)]
MSPATSPRPASLAFLIATYLGLLIGGIVLFYVIIFVMEEFAGLAFPENNSMGLILIAVATMTTGQIWYNRERVEPSSRRKWVLALCLTVVTVAIQAAFIWMVASVAGQLSQFTRELGGRDGTLIIGVFAFLIVLELLMIRASVWWGVRGAIKQEQRKAAKEALPR